MNARIPISAKSTRVDLGRFSLLVLLLVIGGNIYAAGVVGRERSFYEVREDESTVLVGVVLSNGGTTPVTVDYATGDQTAMAGEDYVQTAGKLQFPPGEKLKYISIPILNDSLAEPDKTFYVIFSRLSSNDLRHSDCQLSFKCGMRHSFRNGSIKPLEACLTGNRG